jgi:branched-chain amino acid transport system ATP-binding protein
MQQSQVVPVGKAPLFETIGVSKYYGAYRALLDVSFRVADG